MVRILMASMLLSNLLAHKLVSIPLNNTNSLKIKKREFQLRRGKVDRIQLRLTTREFLRLMPREATDANRLLTSHTEGFHLQRELTSKIPTTNLIWLRINMAKIITCRHKICQRRPRIKRISTRCTEEWVPRGLVSLSVIKIKILEVQLSKQPWLITNSNLVVQDLEVTSLKVETFQLTNSTQQLLRVA